MKKTLTRRIFIGFISIVSIIIGADHSHAATYYIDLDCPYEGGNGTTTDCDGGADDAWNSISDPTYACGNTYLIKRGTSETFHSTKTISGLSCSEGNELEIGSDASYGSGADPIITSYQELDGWSDAGKWIDGSGAGCSGCWYMTITPDGAISDTNYWWRMWLNGTEYANANSAATVSNASKWYYDYSTSPDRLYVYSGGSKPSAVYSSIYFMENQVAFNFVGVDYIRMHDLDIRAPGIGGIQGLNLAYGKFYDMSFYGIRCNYSGDDSCRYNEIYNNTIDNQ
ncbi:hypothetical protein ACFL0B_06185, partial [Thermodesulfobacteriota bacterium]